MLPEHDRLGSIWDDLAASCLDLHWDDAVEHVTYLTQSVVQYSQKLDRNDHMVREFLSASAALLVVVGASEDSVSSEALQASVHCVGSLRHVLFSESFPVGGEAQLVKIFERLSSIQQASSPSSPLNEIVGAFALVWKEVMRTCMDDDCELAVLERCRLFFSACEKAKLRIDNDSLQLLLDVATKFGVAPVPKRDALESAAPSLEVRNRKDIFKLLTSHTLTDDDVVHLYMILAISRLLVSSFDDQLFAERKPERCLRYFVRVLKACYLSPSRVGIHYGSSVEYETPIAFSGDEARGTIGRAISHCFVALMCKLLPSYCTGDDDHDFLSECGPLLKVIDLSHIRAHHNDPEALIEVVSDIMDVFSSLSMASKAYRATVLDMMATLPAGLVVDSAGRIGVFQRQYISTLSRCICSICSDNRFGDSIEVSRQFVYQLGVGTGARMLPGVDQTDVALTTLDALAEKSKAGPGVTLGRLALMVDLACVVSDKLLLSMVLPHVLGNAVYADDHSSLPNLMIRKIGQIGSAQPGAIFRDSLNFLISLYNSTSHARRDARCEFVGETLYQLFEASTSCDYGECAIQMMRLYVRTHVVIPLKGGSSRGGELGADYDEKSKSHLAKARVSSGREPGIWLLRTIGFLLSHIRLVDDDPSVENVVTEYRRMWVMLSLKFILQEFELQTDQAWKREIAKLADCSPVFLSPSGDPRAFFAQMDIFVSDAVRLVNAKDHLSLLRQRTHDIYQQIMTESAVQHNSLTKNLRLQHCMLLLSSYLIESNRSKVDTFERCFKYVQHATLVYSRVDLKAYFSTLGDWIFFRGGNAVASAADARFEGERTLIEGFKYLIAQMCSRRKEHREKAHCYAVHLMKKFRFLNTEGDVLQYLLHVLDAISGPCRSTAVQHHNVALDIGPVRVLYLPETPEARASVFSAVKSFISEYIETAVPQVPGLVQGTLCRYVAASDVFDTSVSGSDSHAILSRFDELLLLLRSKGSDAVAHKGCSVISNIKALKLRSYHAGEVATSIGTGGRSGANASKIALELFSHAMSRLQAKDEWSKAHDRSATLFDHSALFHATATVLRLEEYERDGHKYMRCRQLLRTMSDVVLKSFTKQSAAAIVFCWQWIVSSARSLRSAVIGAACQLWVRSAKQGLGIFSAGKYNEDQCLAHAALIDFWGEACRILGKGFIRQQIHFTLYSTLHSVQFRLVSPILFSSICTLYNVIISTFAVGKSGRNQQQLEWYRLLVAQFSHAIEEGVALMEPLDRAGSKAFANILVEFCDTIQAVSEVLCRESGARSLLFNKKWQSSLSRMQRSGTLTDEELSVLADAMLLFLYGELDRLRVWHNPLGDSSLQVLGPNAASYSAINSVPSRWKWDQFLQVLWHIRPIVALRVGILYTHIPVVEKTVRSLAWDNPSVVSDIGDAVSYILDYAAANDAVEDGLTLSYLTQWSACDMYDGLKCLSPQYQNSSYITNYGLRCLSLLDPAALLLYLPQIVQQCLRRTSNFHNIARFLLEESNKSKRFAHFLIWTLRAELKVEGGYADSIDAVLKLIEDSSRLELPIQDVCLTADPDRDQMSQERALSLINRILRDFDEQGMLGYNCEFRLVDAVTRVSGQIRPIAKDERNAKCIELLSSISVQSPAYLPTSPSGELVEMHAHSALPMQSAEKAPLLVPFSIRQHTEHGLSVVKRSCIFKMGDDCRQDQLALQIISLFGDVFAEAGLPLFVYPYRVVTTAPGCGIIEVVPDSMSRDQVGSAVDGSLYDYFLQTYGDKDSVAFQKARRNFIESMAAYSLLTFILNIKDRHNGNILISSGGHVIHIDFGFILDIHPGGELVNFEPSPFKLTKEMLFIMYDETGGGVMLFAELVVKGFLAVRRRMDDILTTVALMSESGLPCFRPRSIENLRDRFAPHLNDRDAARFMLKKIDKAKEHFMTSVYDFFQNKLEGISY